MNCKYEFEDMFIIENINYTFFKSELKKKQGEILLQIEQSRIPQTQEQAKRILYNENRRKIQMDVNKQKRKLYHIYNLKCNEMKNQLTQDLEKLEASIPPSFDTKKNPSKIHGEVSEKRL